MWKEAVTVELKALLLYLDIKKNGEKLGGKKKTSVGIVAKKRTRDYPKIHVIQFSLRWIFSVNGQITETCNRRLPWKRFPMRGTKSREYWNAVKGIRTHNATVKSVQSFETLYAAGGGRGQPESQKWRVLRLRKTISSNTFLESRPRINRKVWRIHESNDWTISLPGGNVLTWQVRFPRIDCPPPTTTPLSRLQTRLQGAGQRRYQRATPWLTDVVIMASTFQV